MKNGTRNLDKEQKTRITRENKHVTRAKSYRLKVLAKIALGTVGAVTLGYLFVPPFSRKLERNVLRPIRNYRRHLQQEESFKTEEEFYQFLGSVATGTFRMFTIESD